jgi:SAF domain-containing protein
LFASLLSRTAALIDSSPTGTGGLTESSGSAGLMAETGSDEEKAFEQPMSTQEDIEARALDGRNGPANGKASQGSARPGVDRLPRPPGRRRPGLAVVAVLLIVLGAAIAGLLALRIDERVPVLVAGTEIEVGQRITSADLSVARMATEGVSVIPADQAASVIGRYATQTITPGRLIDKEMLDTTGLLASGQAAVGVALKAGRFPSDGVKAGDIVQVVRAADGVGKVIAQKAVVSSVKKPSSSGFGSSAGDTTVVTVVVPERVSPAVAAAGMADQVSLVLLRRGIPTGGG